jgi:cell filamentation protein
VSQPEDDSDNPYRDPNGVPYNLLGVSDADQLRALEYELTAAKQRALLDGSLEIPIREHNAERLSFIHQQLFQRIYAWAGQERTIAFSKAHPVRDNHVGYFSEPEEFPALRAQLAAKADAFVRGSGSKEQTAAELTEIYALANDYHPFPEGNGRSTQVFMRLLARERGYDLDYTRIPKDEWNEAAYMTVTHGEVIDVEGQKYLDPEEKDLGPMREVFERMMLPWDREYVATPVDKEIAQLLEKGTAALRTAGYNVDAPGFSEGLQQAIAAKYAARSSSEYTPQQPDPESPSRPRSR